MSKYELIIAEKPSLGEDVAAALGGGRKKGNYIEGPGWVVTWVVGHLLENLKPQEYDEKYAVWSMDNLPIIPDPFRLKPSKGASSQIALIKRLSKDAHTLTNAGDADREGQLLVDEMFDHIGWNGPEKRIWFNKLTKAGIKQAFEKRTDNRNFRGKSQAGECRSQSDWLMGMNLSPLFSFKYTSETGKRQTMNTGRVLSPVLALIVKRDREIESFLPKDFFEVYANFEIGDADYRGKWAVPEEYLDAEGYLIDKDTVDRVRREIQDKQGEIISAEYRMQASVSPHPFTLTELQKFANRVLGWTSKKVLKTAQSLYATHKMTTYPRTEVSYMSTEQHAESPAILKKVFGFMDKESELDGADWDFKHPVFNDSQLGEHYAIIPTGADRYGRLSNDERALFDLIALRFLAAFYPPKETKILSIETEVEGHLFRSSLSQVMKPGWDVLYGNYYEDEKPLPEIEEGMAPEVVSVDAPAKKTSPPKHFTEATLTDAMKNIAKYVEDDEAQKVLKKVKGLGTPATRADLIEKLKSEKFIQVQRKKVTSTDIGRANIDNSDPEVISPVLTAEWEIKLDQVETGETAPEEFMASMKDWIRAMIDRYDSKITVRSSTRSAGGTFPPSDKQLSLARKLAEDNGVDIPGDALASGKAMSQFIEKFAGKSKGGSKGSSSYPPSEKQMALAQKLADENNVEIPKSSLKNGAEISKFIDKYIGKSKSSSSSAKPPSAKQAGFAEKLADEKGKDLPKGYDTDWRICSAFIDECLGKK